MHTSAALLGAWVGHVKIPYCNHQAYKRLPLLFLHEDVNTILKVLLCDQ